MTIEQRDADLWVLNTANVVSFKSALKLQCRSRMLLADHRQHNGGLLPAPPPVTQGWPMAARRGAPLKGLAHGLHPALRCSMIAKLRTSAPVYSRRNGAGALDLKNQRLAFPGGKISPVRFHIA